VEGRDRDQNDHWRAYHDDSGHLLDAQDHQDPGIEEIIA
jgi:hypothetical protein